MEFAEKALREEEHLCVKARKFTKQDD